MSNLSESLAIISENLKAFAHSFTTKRFIFSIFLLVSISILISISLNFALGTFYFNRINKKIDAIERIENKSDQTEFNASIEKEYASILSELTDYRTKKSFNLTPESKVFNILIKILISLILPLIILIASLKDPDFSNILLGVVMFVFIFGIVSAIIPVIYNLWITGIIIIVLESIILWIFSKIFSS